MAAIVRSISQGANQVAPLSPNLGERPKGFISGRITALRTASFQVARKTPKGGVSDDKWKTRGHQWTDDLISGDPRLHQLAAKASRSFKVKLEMTLEEATLMVQSRWRGFRQRIVGIDLAHQLHLGYELHVFKLRTRRRHLLYGFFQHLIYMGLLILVFNLQHGHTVSTRYTLVETLKNYVRHLKTPSGNTFDNVASIPAVWDWTENAFFREISGTNGDSTDRVFLRTYNQVVGSVRLETVRVTNDSCAYKHSEWSQSVLRARRPNLFHAESGASCYGEKGYFTSSSNFGPWHDQQRWASDSSSGEPRYVAESPPPVEMRVACRPHLPW